MISVDGSSDLNARLAVRLRALRAGRGLTLDALAERTGVSRSMISLVERGESSPTAAVLDRLATGLGVPLASLFAEEERPGAAPLARRGEQPTWRDPASGYVRRVLSPPGYASALQLVEVTLPPGASVAYDGPPAGRPGAGRLDGVDQQVWVLEGRVDLRVGEETFSLAAGDCLAKRPDVPSAFSNPTEAPARYLVALATAPSPANGSPRPRRPTG